MHPFKIIGIQEERVKPTLADRRECTGCSACLNSCPKDAIFMVKDEEGFIFPEIDDNLCIKCLKCQTACPIINTRYTNSHTPECYSMMGQDIWRMNSSSGAFIPLLANWVMDRRGICYGAVWDRGWTVKITRLSSKQELDLMRGSKYLQSYIHLSYRDVLQDLKSDNFVLFTGTPCQIAGLYGFLGNQNFDKLITAEVICHGWPSHKVFFKYLNDNFNINEITKISFRDKKTFGWLPGVRIDFSSGAVFSESAQNNIFFAAFNPLLIMSRACAKCMFCRLPRQADFSAGDFWGVEEYNVKFQDNKGTSFVLINNNKYENIIHDISSKFKLWQKTPIDAVTRLNKTVLAPFGFNPGRKHFYSSLHLKNFNELVPAALNHHYDVGIIGLWYGLNYGSILTYYALYDLIRTIGYDAVMLPKPPGMWDDLYNDSNTIAQQFIWENCNVLLPYNNMDQYRKVNDICDKFVVGSDVVWNYEICGKESGHFFFMEFANPEKTKISFASSFGNNLKGPNDFILKSLELLKNFDFISCREQSGKNFLSNNLQDKNIETVLDPVFLCNKDIYIKLAKKSHKNIKENFCFGYFLNRDLLDDKRIILRMVCDEFALKPIVCANPNTHEFDILCNDFNINDKTPLSVYDWLFYIYKCSYFLGDSYHGLCFSLIFHKNFIILYDSNSLNSSIQRFTHLLKLLNLEDRLIDHRNNFKNYLYLLNNKINWDRVDETLDSNKISSKELLTWALKI